MPSPLEFEGKTELGEREQSPLEVVRRCPVYLLYWYKSTNADAKARAEPSRSRAQVPSLLALLVQKYKCRRKGERRAR
jgi:hypothetical protein